MSLSSIRASETPAVNGREERLDREGEINVTTYHGEIKGEVVERDGTEARPKYGTQGVLILECGQLASRRDDGVPAESSASVDILRVN